MTPEELVSQAKRIAANARYGSGSALIEAKEFLRVYGTDRNSFLATLEEINTFSNDEYISEYLVKTLDAFIRYVESGLHENVSVKRRAEIDVVSDFLGQAHTLLETPSVHPAGGIVLIGAALEEFLRNWIEDQSIDITGKKQGISTYSNALKENKLITKQDVKDITSWSGLRNHAAHGEWDEVGDKTRAALMLEGVNLFMRKYT